MWTDDHRYVKVCVYIYIYMYAYIYREREIYRYIDRTAGRAKLRKQTRADLSTRTYVSTPHGWVNHLSNTTCLMQMFFQRGKRFW